MANLVYNKGLELLFLGDVALETSDIRAMLVKTTYTPNKDHLLVDDGSANDPKSHEITVSGYARQALANMVVTRDDSGDVVYWDADDFDYTGLAAGETVGGIVIYIHTGTDTTSELLCFKDPPDTPTSVGTIPVVFSAPPAGIMSAVGV